MTNYTLTDLEEVQRELQLENERFADYTGNNPNKWESRRSELRRRLDHITFELKQAGILAMTEQELLEQALDKAFPDARSRQIVEYKGQRYMRRWRPVERHRSGLVKRWLGSWEAIRADEPSPT